jgi:hypothetical protein
VIADTDGQLSFTIFISVSSVFFVVNKKISMFFTLNLRLVAIRIQQRIHFSRG